MHCLYRRTLLACFRRLALVLRKVTAALSNVDKHTLPVSKTTCAFSHSCGIKLASAEKRRDGQKCIRDENCYSYPSTRSMVRALSPHIMRTLCCVFVCLLLDTLWLRRVSVVLSKAAKHTLPVDKTTCAFSHIRGIELFPSESRRDSNAKQSACTFQDGTLPTNYNEVWRCMHEADCDITDDWLQMVIFRDPRPTVVSTYFHIKTHHLDKDFGQLDSFIAAQLPNICEWLAVRHILFSGLLSHQSMEFWYDDAIGDPLGWHYHFLDSVGLQLPPDIVKEASEAAAGNIFSFHNNMIDPHPGEKARNGTGAVRRFEEEVSPEIVKIADDILRVWLPPVLQEKLGV